MGPGCFYPGNIGESQRTLRTCGASMGPGCFYPGNATRFHWHRAGKRLQWGRDVSIPEMKTAKEQGFGFSGFNGAGMFLSRKYPHATFASPPSLASMEIGTASCRERV